MKKKGQSAITIAFWVLVFVIGWALFFGGWLAEWGARAVTDNNLTGIEAFALQNLNLVVGVALILFVLAYSVFGGGR